MDGEDDDVQSVLSTHFPFPTSALRKQYQHRWNSPRAVLVTVPCTIPAFFPSRPPAQRSSQGSNWLSLLALPLAHPPLVTYIYSAIPNTHNAQLAQQRAPFVTRRTGS